MVEHTLHGATVWEIALDDLAATLEDFLVPPLTLVSVEQEDKLLLDELSLLRIGGCCSGSAVARRGRRTVACHGNLVVVDSC